MLHMLRMLLPRRRVLTCECFVKLGRGLGSAACFASFARAGWSSPYSSTTVRSLNSYAASCGGNGNEKIFYAHLPPGATIEIGLTSSGYDAQVETRWGGYCPGTTVVACTDEREAVRGRRPFRRHTWTNSEATAQPVFFLVDAWSSGRGEFTVSWTVAGRGDDATVDGLWSTPALTATAAEHKRNILTLVDAIPRQFGYPNGNTWTNLALAAAHDLFTPSPGGARPLRLGIPRVCILITDGGSAIEADTIAAAEALKDEGVTIFAIGAGVGSGGERELRGIASEPVEEHMVLVSSAADIPSLFQRLATTSCLASAQLRPCDGAIEQEVDAGGFRYFRPQPPDGTASVIIEASLCGRGGDGVSLFVSGTERHPGPFRNNASDVSASPTKLLLVDRSIMTGAELYVSVRGDGSTRSQFRIKVYANLFPEASASAPASVAVADGLPAGSTVFADPPAPDRRLVQGLSIVYGLTAPSTLFAVDANSGRIRALQTVRYASGAEHFLAVVARVTTSGSNCLSGVFQVIVIVTPPTLSPTTPSTPSPSTSPTPLPTALPSPAPTRLPTTTAPSQEPTRVPSAAPTTPLPTAAGETFAPSSIPSTTAPTDAPNTPRPTAVGAVPTVHICSAIDVSACGPNPCVPSERGQLCDCGGGEAVEVDGLGAGSSTNPCRDVDIPRIPVPPFDDLPTVTICSAVDQDDCEDQACVVDFQRDPMCLCDNGLGGAGCTVSPCSAGLVMLGVGPVCVAPKPRVLIPTPIAVPARATIGYRIALVNATVRPATLLGRVTFSVSGWRSVGGVGGGGVGAGPSPVAVVRINSSSATPGTATALLHVTGPLPDGASVLQISLTATYTYRGVSNSSTVELRISVFDVADDGGGNRNDGGGHDGGPDSSTNDHGGSGDGKLPGYFLAFILLGVIVLAGVGIFCWCVRKKTGGGGEEGAVAKGPNSDFAGTPGGLSPPPPRATAVFQTPSFGMHSGHGDSGASRSSTRNPTYVAAKPPVTYDQASASPIVGTAVYSRASPGGAVGLTGPYATASPSMGEPLTGTAVYDTASGQLHMPPKRPPKAASVYDMASPGGSSESGGWAGDSVGYLDVAGAGVPSPMYDMASGHQIGNAAVKSVPMYERAGGTRGGAGSQSQPPFSGQASATRALRAAPTYNAVRQVSSPVASKAGVGVHQAASSYALAGQPRWRRQTGSITSSGGRDDLFHGFDDSGRSAAAGSTEA